MRRHTLALCVVLGSVLPAACLSPRESLDAASPQDACVHCHGSKSHPNAEIASAPPRDLRGNTEVTARGVGAHQHHLQGGPTHAAIACGTCHLVPQAVEDAGHNDTAEPAEVIFAGLGTKREGALYDDGTSRCATYCHGSAPSAAWNAPRSSADACGSCHGLPPTWPHPQSEKCVVCHTQSVVTAGVFTAPALHVNGVVEVAEPACDTCHGTGANGAPPPSLTGALEPTDPAVGAHAVHLAGRGRSRVVACEECHEVPGAPVDDRHPNGGRAEVELTGVATTSLGDTATYDLTTRTCTSWCHGLGSGASSPAWNSGELGCDGCHGAPPPAPHPQSEQCFACHPDVSVDRTFVPASEHIDGTVQVAITSSCAACHGTGDDPAPPRDLSGETSTQAMGVGAHQAHLVPTGRSKSLACGDCHPLPDQVLASGHTNGSVELAFGPLARAFGVSPSYVDGRCTNFCHSVEQVLRPGGGKTSPAWNESAGPAGDCTMCHALPPPAPHPANDQCSTCHSNIDTSRVFTAPALHVDGKVTY